MKKRNAFTLAEVLITLGIIGIVAAITIPAVKLKIDDREKIVHWKKMYSLISQAYTKTIVDGYKPCQRIINNVCFDNFETDFLEAYQLNLNAKLLCAQPGTIEDTSIKQCDSTDRVYNYFHHFKNLAGVDVGHYATNMRVLQLKTGEQVMFGNGGNGLLISVSINGYGKGENMLGKEIFVTKAYDEALKPMGADGTFNKQLNGEVCKCGKDYGNKTSVPYFEYQELPSGVCCSAYYLTK